MTEAEAGAAPRGPAPLVITARGVTTEVRPCGWRDLVEIPAEYNRIVQMPTETAEEDAAFVAALVAFADRIDAYWSGGVRPSMIPPSGMREFVVRWTRGVRDAAVPPTSAAGSPKRASPSPRATRRKSPSRSASPVSPGG